MTLRERIQDGQGRLFFTLALPAATLATVLVFWPSDANFQERLLRGMQSVAFVAAAFAVTAYNLRTRVIDFALKSEGTPAQVAEFCGIARRCGRRLTNLVLLFTATAALLAVCGMISPSTPIARYLAASCLALLAASVVSFVYILFSFDRLERFALDGAEKASRKREADRLFKQPAGT